MTNINIGDKNARNLKSAWKEFPLYEWSNPGYAWMYLMNHLFILYLEL